MCRDCEQEFAFSAQEQQDYKERKLGPPTRCPVCHEKRNSRRNYGRGGDVKTFTAPCCLCGNDAELPFRPSVDKPVYCDECYKAQHSTNTSNSHRKEFVLRKPAKVNHETETAQSDEVANTASFADFNFDPRLERAITSAGYESPTPVQAATIPLCLSGKDIIGTAQTGTGKTAAFVLPILQHILDNPVKVRGTRAIIVTPTRELAEQINDSFNQLGRFTRIRTATVYGGVGMGNQVHALRTGAEIIIACPGRLLDHMERGNTNFTNVEKVVLDEADRMLDMGFLPPIKRILKSLPQERHTMLFSATFAPELMKLATAEMNDPKRVSVDICAPPKTVAHMLYPCPQHLKTPLVLRLLDEIDANSVLIFTRTKHRANKVAQQIEKAGYGTAAMHANKTQSQRQAALDEFRSGRCQILVATDIAARGLDVETISHVINYDIPDTVDAYIHRIGRTGRAEREGDAMTLVTRQDAGIVWDIEKALGAPIERRKLEDFNYLEQPTSPEEAMTRPMQQQRRRPSSGPSASPTKVRMDGSPVKDSASARNAGRFYEQRKFKGRKSSV